MSRLVGELVGTWVGGVWLDWLVVCLVGWYLVGMLVVWLAGELVGRLVGLLGLVGCWWCDMVPRHQNEFRQRNTSATARFAS